MRITKLILETGDAQALGNYYASVLELPVQLHHSGFSLNTGSIEVVFNENRNEKAFYHFAMNIPANKIEEARSWLSRRTALLWMDDYNNNIADFVNWRAKSVYFIDPAGNILELIARFDLENEEDKAFSSKQFLSVSEIGIVFPENEIDQRTEKLLQQYQLSYFSKQPPLPQFKAAGDDEGLFIIVTNNRNWYPTRIPSGIYPMEIEFENKGNVFQMKM